MDFLFKIINYLYEILGNNTYCSYLDSMDWKKPLNFYGMRGSSTHSIHFAILNLFKIWIGVPNNLKHLFKTDVIHIESERISSDDAQSTDGILTESSDVDLFDN